jgi:hypothetical protein
MKDKLLIEKFEPTKGYKEVEKAEELEHLNDAQKLQLVIGYLFSMCNRMNGNMSYAWQNDAGKDVAVCYVFLGEQASEIRQLVANYNEREAQICRMKQAAANTAGDDSKLYQVQMTANLTDEDLTPRPKKTILGKIKSWIKKKFRNS